MKRKIILILTLIAFIPALSFGGIKVRYLQVRECGNIISMNKKRSLQDKLNKKVQEKLNKIDQLHRVISINYTRSEGMVRKNCALATVWYEIKK